MSSQLLPERFLFFQPTLDTIQSNRTKHFWTSKGDGKGRGVLVSKENLRIDVNVRARGNMGCRQSKEKQNADNLCTESLRDQKAGKYEKTSKKWCAVPFWEARRGGQTRMYFLLTTAGCRCALPEQICHDGNACMD